MWLLLLLIALLPLRGSFAAAVLCHEVGHAPAQAQAHDHAMQTSVGHDHDAASGAGQQHEHGADKCNLCAGLTTPACPAAFGAVPAIAAPAAGVVPQPTVWPASFVSAGLKRPPRSA